MVTYLLCCVHVSPTKMAIFDTTGILLSIKCKLEYMVNYYSTHCSMKLDNTKLSLLITTYVSLNNNYIHFNILLFCFAHYHHQIQHLIPHSLYQQVSGNHCIVSTKLDNNNTYNQEYIIEERESILLHYSTV